VDSQAIHSAIARVFVENHIGYNRRPVLVSTLVRLVAKTLGHENPDPALTLKIASAIYTSDKYVIIKQGTLDTVISSK
jgi:hypothetical protein